MTALVLARGVERALKDLVPARIRVARRALRSWRDGEAELHLLPRLCSHERWSIDVGANNGVYAWHLARWSAGVTAFEPQPAHAAFLARAFGPRVTVEQVALSDSAGEARLRVPVARDEDGRATIEPRNTLARQAVAEYAVRCRRLDSYRLPPVGLIKIDVEGHELAVLRGAQAILERDRPNLIVESEDRHHPGAPGLVRDFLAAFGYTPHVCRNGRLLPLAAAPATGAQAGGVNFVYLADCRAAAARGESAA